MHEISEFNVPRAYAEAILKMRVWATEEESRNGPVLTVAEPVLLSIEKATERVLADPVRDANPFFHVMEFIWMMAGENNVKWIEQFNKRFRDYADPGTDIIHASYGHRWIKHFGRNQIAIVAGMLRDDRHTRRAVISMWDPRVDLSPHNDLPCNTQIMFRWNKRDERLDMTVVNRSNDLIWGMLGANAVHMTYLFELICHEAKLPMGVYKVFTNNLHIYTEMPKFEEIWKTLVYYDVYDKVQPYQLLSGNEHQTDLVSDCMDLIENKRAHGFRTHWMNDVGKPIHDLWFDRGGNPDRIVADDWRISCQEWLNRRKGSIK